MQQEALAFSCRSGDDDLSSVVKRPHDENWLMDELQTLFHRALQLSQSTDISSMRSLSELDFH